MSTPNEERQLESIKDSIVEVLGRIRKTATRRGKTELPTAEFSNALNSVGERFVDLLLQNERTGKWWLGDNGEWMRCTVQSTGRRVTRNFFPSDTPEWQALGSTTRHIADPMTGPDHIVTVAVPTLNLNTNVVLEQKLRFATRQDAFAGSSTYMKHLLYKTGCKLPAKSSNFVLEAFCEDLRTASINVLNTALAGKVLNSGTVPMVCFLSAVLPPYKIVVIDKDSGGRTECNYVGFLPPIVDEDSLRDGYPAAKVVRKAKVHLWLGLDTLIDQCSSEEVEAAWNTALRELGEEVRNPRWRVESGAEDVDGN